MNKRKMLSVFFSVVLVLALVCGSASADLKRGSRGEEVKEMQQMMIDLGVLNDVADGAFGKKTEAAVKKLQQYWGDKQNGRANDTFLMKLNDLWHMALGNGTESGFDPEEDMENPVRTCGHNESAAYGYDYCYRHEEAKALRDLLNPGKGRTVPEGLKKVILLRIREYWLEQIPLLYDEWAETASDDDVDIALEQKDLFEEGWAEAEPDLAEANGGADTLKTREAWANWLENIGIELCFDLHGAEPNPG